MAQNEIWTHEHFLLYGCVCFLKSHAQTVMDVKSEQPVQSILGLVISCFAELKSMISFIFYVLLWVHRISSVKF